MNAPAESQSAFLVCTFSMLGKIAAVDGRVSPQEVSRVERYIDSELKLDKRTKALAMKIFHEAVSSPLELRDYAERFQRTYPDRLQLIDQMIGLLLELSLVDGEFSAGEEELIRSAALLLGLSVPGYERLKQKHQHAKFGHLLLPKH